MKQPYISLCHLSPVDQETSCQPYFSQVSIQEQKYSPKQQWIGLVLHLFSLIMSHFVIRAQPQEVNNKLICPVKTNSFSNISLFSLF